MRQLARWSSEATAQSASVRDAIMAAHHSDEESLLLEANDAPASSNRQVAVVRHF